MDSNGSFKTLTIGDIHGKNVWFEVKNKINEYDKVIFIGDYTDAFDIKDYEMLSNLNNIINFKKEYPDKIVLLLGNHDLQYYFADYNEHMCSGFRFNMFFTLHSLFKDNKELFTPVAYQYKNYLWSHAGIASGATGLINLLPADKMLWADELNRLFYANNKELFEPGEIRGSYGVGSIFWADKSETRKNQFDDLYQIIGHSFVLDIIQYKNNTYVDCLDTIVKFYELEIE